MRGHVIICCHRLFIKMTHALLHVLKIDDFTDIHVILLGLSTWIIFRVQLLYEVYVNQLKDSNVNIYWRNGKPKSGYKRIDK